MVRKPPPRSSRWSAKLKAPRVVWLMVPAGEITDNTITSLVPLLAAGDTIIDGGNSNYRDTQRRAAAVAQRKIQYVDSGTSGGIWGLGRRLQPDDRRR